MEHKTPWKLWQKITTHYCQSFIWCQIHSKWYYGQERCLPSVF